jgi:uncharacterized membrane protein YidH (DUF202 family)
MKHAYTVAFAAVCVMAGVYWDISWHMSIGRDTFWTPAHLLIQAGGLLAGLSSGWVVLRTTFAGSEADRAASVGFWGFRGPLGAWLCIWGCGAMLTSAPFDNWWHNAYGLDVKIVSPPHAVLALGIFSICLGAVLLTLAQQNRATTPEARGRLAWLLAATGGLIIMNAALFLTEYSERRMMHSAFFYEVTALVFPIAIGAMARAINLKWPATAAAAFYTAIMLVLMWIIEQFPATPKLGPIYQHVTHMVSLSFPLLLIFPAFCVDLVLHRLDKRLTTLQLAPIVGVVFVLAFAAVQWPFATFLVTNPVARGPLFNGDNFVYFMAPSYEAMTRRFDPPAPGSWPFPAQMLLAIGIATATSAIGLARGRWMTKVRR